MTRLYIDFFSKGISLNFETSGVCEDENILFLK